MKASGDFAPLTVVRIGDTVRIDRPLGARFEWTNADFARLFLLWLAGEYPACRNAWISVHDIEDEFSIRFIEAAECHSLQLGALLRGLGKVTLKRERTYTDWTGKRCSMTEYKNPEGSPQRGGHGAQERLSPAGSPLVVLALYYQRNARDRPLAPASVGRFASNCYPLLFSQLLCTRLPAALS